MMCWAILDHVSIRGIDEGSHVISIVLASTVFNGCYLGASV